MVTRSGSARHTVFLALLLAAGAGEPRAADTAPPPWRVAACRQRLILLDTAPLQPEPDGGALPHVFYLDLQAVGAVLGNTVNTASMRLLPRDGDAALPFSLDWRYGDREPGPAERGLPVTGYNGEKYPLAAGELRRLGYLSLRPLPGVSEYHLYFDVVPDPAALRPRPDPSVRPWWVDAVLDPEFEVDQNHDGKPDLYTWNVAPGQGSSWGIVPRPGADDRRCLRLTQPEGGRLVSKPGLLAFDPRVAGRRLVLYQQLYAVEGLSGQSVGVSLPNAYRDPGYALMYYFREIPAAEWYEVAIAGRVRAKLTSASYAFYGTYSGPCCIGETHLQFPPEQASGNRIGIDTDVAEPDDEIRCTWQCTVQPYLFALRATLETRGSGPRVVPAQRLDAWSEGFRLAGTLATLGGESLVTVAEAVPSGESSACILRLHDAAPGRYRMSFVVTSRRPTPEVLARLEADLWVREGPFGRGSAP